MKKLLLSVFVMVTAFMAGASVGGYKSIVLHHQDGTKLAITIEDGMTTKVGDGNLTLQCDKGTITKPLTDLKFWNYSLLPGEDFETAGIQLTESDTVGLIVENDRVVFQNLPAGSSVGLVSVDGRVLFSESACGYYEISLSELTHGVYILTYNGKSLKIAVK